MSTRRLLCLLGALAAVSTALAESDTSYFERRAEGWFWYHDPTLVQEEEAPAAPDPAAPAAVTPDTVDPVEALARLKAQLEQALATAIMLRAGAPARSPIAGSRCCGAPRRSTTAWCGRSTTRRSRCSTTSAYG